MDTHGHALNFFLYTGHQTKIKYPPDSFHMIFQLKFIQ